MKYINININKIFIVVIILIYLLFFINYRVSNMMDEKRYIEKEYVLEEKKINTIQLGLMKLQESKKIEFISQKHLNLEEININNTIIPKSKDVVLNNKLAQNKIHNNSWRYKVTTDKMIRNKN